MEIKGAELIIYVDDDGGCAEIDLSPVQLQAVLLAIGFEITEKGYSVWGDSSIQEHIIPKISFKPKE